MSSSDSDTDLGAGPIDDLDDFDEDFEEVDDSEEYVETFFRNFFVSL